MRTSPLLLLLAILVACPVAPVDDDDTSMADDDDSSDDDDEDLDLPDWDPDEVCGGEPTGVPPIWGYGFGTSPAWGEFTSWGEDDEARFLRDEDGEEVNFYAPVAGYPDLPDLDQLGLLQVWGESSSQEYGINGDFAAASTDGELLVQVGYAAADHDDGVRFSVERVDIELCPAFDSTQGRSQARLQPLRLTRGDLEVFGWEGQQVQADGYLFTVGHSRDWFGEWLDEGAAMGGKIRYTIVPTL